MLTLLIDTFIYICMLTLIGQWVRDTADSSCKTLFNEESTLKGNSKVIKFTKKFLRIFKTNLTKLSPKHRYSNLI